MLNKLALNHQQSQNQKLGQKLSARQAQFMRLLQMPQIELQQELQQLIVDNPLLEFEDDNIEESFPDEISREDEDFEQDSLASPTENDALSLINNSLENGDSFAFESEVTDFNSPSDNLDNSWDFNKTYENNINSDNASSVKTEKVDSVSSVIESSCQSVNNVFNELLQEAKAKAIDPKQEALVEIIIGYLDEQGFLNDDLPSIQKEIERKTNINIDLKEYAKALELIQCLEPAGVGARDLRECLVLQCERLTKSRLKNDCLKILENKSLYNLYSQKETRKLLQKTAWEKERLADVYGQISKFSPSPVADILLDEDPIDYIIPEVIVRKNNHQWQVFANENLPKLRINNYYAQIINGYRYKNKINKKLTSAPTPPANELLPLVEKLADANLIKRDLKNRSTLILQIAKYIVEHQRAYFELGEIAIKPLLQKELAEHFTLHISSISRIVSGKYMDTPRGVLPFNYFLVRGKVAADFGGEYSSNSVVAMIRNIIAKENSDKPLRDEEIGKKLAEEGVVINTRTIAKYRGENNIPSCFQRIKKITAAVE